MSWRATSIFGPRATSTLPPGQMTVSALSSQSKAMPSPTWLAAIMSSFLRLSLLRALFSTSSVSAANPTTNGRLAMSATDLMMSGAGSRSSWTATPCFFILFLATVTGWKSATAAVALNKHAPAALRQTAPDIARALHVDARDAGRRLKVHGPGDDGVRRAGLAGRGGDGNPHFSRAAVREI